VVGPRSLSAYTAPFEILDYNVLVWDDGPTQYGRDGVNARATVKLRVQQEVVNRYVVKELRKLGDLASDAANLASLAASMASKSQVQGTELLEVAEGNGPVNALGKCLVKALLPLFPSLEFVELSDYKVPCPAPSSFAASAALGISRSARSGHRRLALHDNFCAIPFAQLRACNLCLARVRAWSSASVLGCNAVTRVLQCRYASAAMPLREC
jgi:hypothetical protein